MIDYPDYVDAIHIENPCKPRVLITLCNQTAINRSSINITDKWPDPWSGCWTCLAQAELMTNNILT